MNVARHSLLWMIAVITAASMIACDAQIKVSTDTPNDSLSDADGDSTAIIRYGDVDSGGSNTDASNGGPAVTGGGDGGSNTSGGTKPAPTGNIRVSSPKAGDLITGRRFTLVGEARTFENTGNYRLRAGNGTVLAEGHFTAVGEMGVFSQYSTMVEINRDYSDDALLEVYESSAKDGSEINMVRVPLVIRTNEQAAASGVSVFFTNSEKNPGAIDCSRVYPTRRRTGATSAVARAALEELLKGPTSAERAQKFDTEIPSGTRLRDVVIEGGVATVDFTRELNTAAGSCRVTAARAQIERTLRQFPSVQSVVIAVNGNSKEVLQP